MVSGDTMLNTISINNFRGIKEFTISDFKKINLLVGKNNSGKSTILESIFLLIGISNPELSIRINNFRGMLLVNESNFKSLFHNGDINHSIIIEGKFTFPPSTRRLEISPKLKNISYDYNLSANQEINKIVSDFSPKLEGLVINFQNNVNGNRKPFLGKSSLSFKNGEIIVEPVKNYKEVNRGILLSPLNIYLDLIRRFNELVIKKEKEYVITILKEIEPDLEDLTIGSDGYLYADLGMNQLLPINILGDGIIKILSIILSLYDARNGIVLLDEIENGIYYGSQIILWKAIFNAVKLFNVQLFTTTHSIECIRAFILSAEESDSKDDIQLLRLERKRANFYVTSFNYTTLSTALNSEWEIR